MTAWLKMGGVKVFLPSCPRRGAHVVGGVVGDGQTTPSPSVPPLLEKEGRDSLFITVF